MKYFSDKGKLKNIDTFLIIILIIGINMELKQNKDIRLWQYPVGSIVDHIHMNNMKIYAQEIYEEYIKWKDTSNGKVGIQIFCRVVLVVLSHQVLYKFF